MGDLFNLRSIQQALQTVWSLCTDSQKKKFSDLFALADSESEDESLMKPKQSSKTKPPSKSPAKPKAKSSGGSVRNSESSGESTESEDELEPAPPKKGGKGRGSKPAAGRKRAIVTKVSYKEMASTDYSSDDEENPRTPKKKKKIKMSGSESD